MAILWAKAPRARGRRSTLLRLYERALACGAGLERGAGFLENLHYLKFGNRGLLRNSVNPNRGITVPWATNRANLQSAFGIAWSPCPSYLASLLRETGPGYTKSSSQVQGGS